jgi:hypothetical protein
MVSDPSQQRKKQNARHQGMVASFGSCPLNLHRFTVPALFLHYR